MNLWSAARAARCVRRLWPAVISGCLALVSLAPLTAIAGTTSWDADATLIVGTHTLSIVAPSSSDSLSVDPVAGTFTVSVASSETFKIRYPGAAGSLPNTGGLPSCNNVGGNNDVTVTGPATVTFTPNSTTCAAAGGGGGQSQTPQTTLAQPNGGQSLAAGSTYDVFWSASGSGITSMTLALSTDGGATYATIAVGEFNDGFYQWTVPSTATVQGRIRIQAIGTGGTVLATDASDGDFTITVPSTGGGAPSTTAPPPTTTEPTTPPPTTTTTFPTGTNDPVQYSEEEKAAPTTDPNTSGSYSATDAEEATPSIDVDKDIEPPPPEVRLPCVGGSLIGTAESKAVYYCGKNGRRYVFPNQKIFSTWFKDFSALKILSAADMAKVPIGGNVTYKPGVRMIKITTDPKVYAIARDGVLRWVSSETAAAKLYGTFWNQHIDDVPDAFFFNYKIGDPITDADVANLPAPPPPPVAQACSSATIFTIFQNIGTTHAEVSALQDLLKCLGFLPATLASTGYYGGQTSAAVAAFQAANGLTAAGYVGPATRDVLNTKY